MGIFSTAYEELYYEALEEYEIFLLCSRTRIPGLGPEEGTLEHPYFIDPEKLNGMRVLLPASGGGQYQAADHALKKHDIVPVGEICCGNLHTLYELAAADCGFLFCTPQDFIMRYPKETKSIAFCRLRDETMLQKVYMTWRREDTDDPMIREMAEDLRLSVHLETRGKDG